MGAPFSQPPWIIIRKCPIYWWHCSILNRNIWNTRTVGKKTRSVRPANTTWSCCIENRVVIFDCGFDSLVEPQVEAWTYDRKEIPSSRVWHLRVGSWLGFGTWQCWRILTQFVRLQQPVSLRFQQSISAIPPLIANSNGRYAVVRVFLQKRPEAPLDSQDKLAVRGAT